MNGEQIIFGQQAPFFVTSKKGFGAVENQITTQKQYGLDGEFFVNQSLTTREIEIDGEIVTTDSEDLTELRIKLSSVLNPSLAGTLTYQADGRTFVIDVLVEEAPTIDDSPKNLSQTFSLKFKALDPYWADQSEQNRLIQLSSVVNAFKFPLQIINDFVFANIKVGDIQQIENKGDVIVGMKIELKVTGAVINPKILNVVTQEYFGFAGSYDNGTVFNIVTIRGKKEVTKTLNGVTTNAMSERLPDSSFLQLDKGNNFLTLQADNGVGNVIGSISFSPLVVGV